MGDKILIQQSFDGSLHGTGCQFVSLEETGGGDFTRFPFLTDGHQHLFLLGWKLVEQGSIREAQLRQDVKLS